MKYLVLLALLCFSCASNSTLAPVPGNSVGYKAAIDADIKTIEETVPLCRNDGAWMCCPTPGWLDTITAAANLYRTAGLLKSDLVEAVENRRIDQEKHTSELQIQKDDLKRARWMKIVWGVIGIAVGAIGVGTAFVVYVVK